MYLGSGMLSRKDQSTHAWVENSGVCFDTGDCLGGKAGKVEDNG
jgi:hypothetical protein